MPLVRSNHLFASEGTALRGHLIRLEGDALRPVVVMAHGFSAVAEQLQAQAEVFARAGLAVFVYDHAGFGLSEGYPRGEVDPTRQVRGYRDAVSYVRTVPGLNPERVGIWGSSMSGGHVLQAAALDRRVGCVVSQVPFISGSALLRAWPGGAALIERFVAEREARSQGAPATLIPVIAAEGTAALSGRKAFAYFSSTGGKTWRNEVTLSSFELVQAHEPGWWIDQIAPTPLMMIVADDDTVTPTTHALDAFARAGEPKRLLRLPGSHFAAYEGQGFDLAVGGAADWFCQHLGRTA